MIVQKAIEDKLTTGFAPVYLKVINESSGHNVPAGSETHFKVLMVASAFEGKPMVARHRLVNKALAWELSNGVHALTMKVLTPEQWEAAGRTIESESPPCASKQS